MSPWNAAGWLLVAGLTLIIVIAAVVAILELVKQYRNNPIRKSFDEEEQDK